MKKVSAKTIDSASFFLSPFKTTFNPLNLSKMALTSQITAQPIFGSNPAGFVPLTPNNGGATDYAITQAKDLSFDYVDLTFGANIPATKDNFLVMVKDYLDTTYMPSVFTDTAKNYDAVYTVTAVRLDFETVSGDRSIWTERSYKWYVKVIIQVNVN